MIVKLFILYLNNIIIPNIYFIIFYYKLDILKDLINSLKKIDITKNKQKKIHNIVIKEI